MKKTAGKLVGLAVAAFGTIAMPQLAEARAGGGMSMGSMGSRGSIGAPTTSFRSTMPSFTGSARTTTTPSFHESEEPEAAPAYRAPPEAPAYRAPAYVPAPSRTTAPASQTASRPSDTFWTWFYIDQLMRPSREAQATPQPATPGLDSGAAAAPQAGNGAAAAPDDQAAEHKKEGHPYRIAAEIMGCAALGAGAGIGLNVAYRKRRDEYGL